MKESQKREFERLETLDDYFAEFERLSDASDVIPEAQLDKICVLLSKALIKKYKYVINFSAPFRRKQSLMSKMAEKREEKLEEKREKEEENSAQEEKFRQKLLSQLQKDNPSEAQLGSPPCPALEQEQVTLLQGSETNLLDDVDDEE